jgi:putative membrane protein
VVAGSPNAALAGSAYLAAFALSIAALVVCARATAETRHARCNPRETPGLVVAALALVLALASPLDELSDHLFSAHMVEHELFLYTIPLALLASRPALLAFVNLRRLPLRWRRSLGQVSSQHPGWLDVASYIGRPLPAFLLSGLVLWGWHAPALYDLALRNGWAHALEHLCFLATALLYWRPLLSSTRRAMLGSNARRALYLIAGGMQGGLLGAFIALSGHVIYAGYLAQPGAAAVAVIGDQQLGGAIMWFSGAVFCGAMAAITMR